MNEQDNRDDARMLY